MRTEVVKVITPADFPYQWRCAAEACAFNKPIMCRTVESAESGASSHVAGNHHAAIIEALTYDDEPSPVGQAS